MVQRDVLNNSSKDKSVQERGYETLKGCNKSFTTFFSPPFSLSLWCAIFFLLVVLPACERPLCENKISLGLREIFHRASRSFSAQSHMK